MTLITLTVTNYPAVTLVLSKYYPDQKHSHRTEALAYALGLRTYQDIRIKLQTEGELTATISEKRFVDRLHQFGYKKVPVYPFETLCVAACVGGPLPENSKPEPVKPMLTAAQPPTTTSPTVVYKKNRKSLLAPSETANSAAP